MSTAKWKASTTRRCRYCGALDTTLSRDEDSPHLYIDCARKAYNPFLVGRCNACGETFAVLDLVKINIEDNKP